ncbi:hypothetical protein ACFFJY_14080 [Fictibacillus aquaticus]|uniref:Uncharacterized protein n=1 Tax=Fictibacillus aquaticus TaxID=2021314 RepID=A0A235FEJ2_9BACL|nr:hypothetical protein [Fictibacillus aquaticus]OYD59347.1 hypothetical protein CGZ90_05505 [Fictibacillus aquaticus]
MYQQIQIENWLLEIDILRTREFYKNGLEVCNCLYCNNYIAASKSFDSSVVSLFHSLGITSSFPAHLSEFPATEEGMRMYIGVYHAVGRVLNGELCATSNWTEKSTFQIDNFTFGFSDETEFVPEGLPSPVLQLKFEAHIPWVLEEKPDEFY